MFYRAIEQSSTLQEPTSAAVITNKWNIIPTRADKRSLTKTTIDHRDAVRKITLVAKYYKMFVMIYFQ